MKVAFITQPEYFRFIYEDDLAILGDVKEFPFTFTMDEANFLDLISFNADVNFFFRGEYIPNSVLKQLQGIKVNLSSEPFPRILNGRINYSIDSLRRFKEFMSIADKSFDYIFHYDKNSLPFMEKFGVHISGDFYFPTSLYENNSIEPKEEKWDLFFIGRSTKHREQFFSYLKHHYHFLHICHGVVGKDLLEYVRQSKIILNVHAENEISWEPRVQMMMAMGKLVISEKISQNDYLAPGVDYVEVTNPKKMYKAVHYYLHNEEERRRIAQNGRKKIEDMFHNKKCIPLFIENIHAGKYARSHINFTSLQKIKLKLYTLYLINRITFQKQKFYLHQQKKKVQKSLRRFHGIFKSFI